jgi:hypothetical protein
VLSPLSLRVPSVSPSILVWLWVLSMLPSSERPKKTFSRVCVFQWPVHRHVQKQAETIDPFRMHAPFGDHAPFQCSMFLYVLRTSFCASVPSSNYSWYEHRISAWCDSAQMLPIPTMYAYDIVRTADIGAWKNYARFIVWFGRIMPGGHTSCKALRSQGMQSVYVDAVLGCSAPLWISLSRVMTGRAGPARDRLPDVGRSRGGMNCRITLSISQSLWNSIFTKKSFSKKCS